MIPISLIITLEIIKIIQGYFMSCDVEMYSHVRERYVKAGSISLNEELGHVNYLFSDKTGTLTSNKMVFKYCVIGETCYEYVRPKKEEETDKEEKKNLRKKLDITEIGPKYMENFIGSESTKVNPNRKDGGIVDYILDNAVIINEFWKALATGHECTIDEKNGNFMGLSPDDIELLKAAKEQGFECVRGETNTKRYIKMKDDVRSFEILRLNEFSSDRRRMSIIVRDGNSIKLYLKGADTEVLKRLSKNSNEKFINSSRKYIDFFSQYGYRTLLVAMRILDEKTYEEWNNRYKQASLDFKHKKENLEELQNEIENDLHLIGATIVEDKLQDQVPETIRDLRLAGIKIWMLTGDKFSTALNIALSCNLISNDMKMFKIRGERNENIDFLIDEFSKYYNENDVEIHELPPYGLVIDSVALCVILNDPENLSNFLLIAHNAASVICCRVSPLQKAEVVKAMKNYNKKAVVMSIGDGGNDVSMLMEAHIGKISIKIGIGVYGEEGMRAVQASDFAIGEFKILSRLLMFHGRTNYLRITEMILYFFFKNFLFSINHFYFAFYNNASGQTVIDDWFISLFNLVFTSCPLAARAILDHDLKPDDGKMIRLLLPYLYLENKNSPIFSITNFFVSIFRGLSEGFIIFIVLSNVLNDTIADSNGNFADLWFLSVNMFTIIIVVVSLRILVVQKYYTILNIITMMITTFVFYSIFVVYVNTSEYFHSCGTMIVSFNSPVLWMSTIFVSGLCFLIDYGCYSWSVIFSSELTERLRILINEKGKLEKEEDLHSDILPYLQQYEKVNNSKKTHYHFEDDKKSEKNLNDNFTNDNAHDGDMSITETKKNLYKTIFNDRKEKNNLNRSKSFSDNNRFLSDNEDTFNHKLRENNKIKKINVNKDEFKQLSEKNRKKPLIN
jgi:phospholipid-translocating P-type ATPase (flippase)